MAKFSQCDCCGYKDDWCYEPGKPILDGGVLIEFFSQSTASFERIVELCPKCRKKLENFLSSLTTHQQKTKD